MLQECTFFNLTEANLCVNCSAVGNSANRCPRCQSRSLLSIERVIQADDGPTRLIAFDRESN
jgi:hypothetical protein